MTFSEDQAKQLALIVDAVVEHRLKASSDAAAAAAAAAASAAAAAAPLNPVTATPAEMLAALTGSTTTTTQPTVLPTVNPLAGKPAYVRFPSIPQAVLLDIMSHKLVFKDLIKLDVAYSRVSTEPIMSLSNGQLTFDNKVTSKHFATPAMMLNCLSVYFDVLAYHVGSSMSFEAAFTVGHGWSLLQRRILQFASTYKWSAVVSFLEEYYYKRVAEMLDGKYCGWWDTDTNLESFWLAGNLLAHSSGASLTSARSPNPRAPSSSTSSTPAASAKAKGDQICYAFLAGACASPCRNGRKHEKPPSA